MASFWGIQASLVKWLCVRLNVAWSQILHKAEFLLIRGFFYFFFFHLIELLFGRVLASVSEAQLRLVLHLRSQCISTNIPFSNLIRK